MLAFVRRRSASGGPPSPRSVRGPWTVPPAPGPRVAGEAVYQKNKFITSAGPVRTIPRARMLLSVIGLQ